MLMIVVFSVVAWIIYEERTDASEIFRLAEQKAAQYKVPGKDYAVIIDFRRSMLARRLYLVDLKNRRIVLRSRVSHAFRSGLLYAADLSNKEGSNKSCAGAFITADPYYGKFGYSMHIRGLENGVNNNARGRAIVFHSIKKVPFPTWSHGCFVTPSETNAQLIKKISNGRLVYVVSG
jgi:hypothetical protein